MIYNADNFEFMSLKLSIEEILNRLKIKKNQIMREEEETKERIMKFYERLRELIMTSEKVSMNAINQQMLDFHQQIGESVKYMSSKNKSGDYQSVVSKIMELLECKIIDGPKIDESKLQTLIIGIYEARITNQIGKIQQSELINDFPDAVESDNSLGFKQSIGDIAIQKLQGERDYYQRREQELLSRIKQLQNGMARKGINIKEMSRSYLEDKCSRWALERLKEEKKILVQKIGEASQQVIKLNNQMGEQQLQIKKLSSLINEMNSRSGVGSIMKNNSTIADWQVNKKQRPAVYEQINNDRIIELESKNEQLMIQITKSIKKQKELSEKNNWLEEQIENYSQAISQLNAQINELKQLNLIVNHDYEISLRRKAVFQQECSQLKSQLNKVSEQVTEGKETYKTVINDLQQKQIEIVDKIKRIEQTKRQEISLLESRVKEMQLQRQHLLKRLEEVSTKKGEEINYKQLLNEQITRLLKQNAILSSSLESKQQSLFLIKQQNNKVSGELKQLQNKIDQSKRQSVRFKKQNKDLEKHISELQKKNRDQVNLEYKVAQLEQNCIMLQSQFLKYKQSADKKISTSLRSIQVIKERFSVQLNGILGDQLKAKGKKGQNRLEAIEKYIQQMISLSNKSALIKQLKEENRLLKEGKDAKSVPKKVKCLFTEQTVIELQNGLWTMATKILEERLKSEKDLFDLQLKELKQTIAKQQMQKLGLQQQLQRQKQKTASLKLQQKQQTSNEDMTKTIKQNEQRLQKMQAQLRGNRAMIRKLQSQIYEDQSEIKIKRQLALGLKKQCKQKEDIIRQLQSELTINQEELQKLKRGAKEMNKKESMFKQIKDKQVQLEQRNGAQKKTIQTLEQKVKMLSKQLDKKQSILKELRSIEDKQNKTRQEEKTQQTNETIIEQREYIRRMKAEVDRKDEIIKNLKGKAETRSKELQTIQSTNEREIQKNRKQLETVQRKLQASKITAKKQQSKNYFLAIAIKKIYEYCSNLNIREQQTANNKKRQSTQYFSGSSASSHALKSITPINTKTIPHYEGLAILNLSTEDLMDFQSEPTGVSKIHANFQSYEIASPMINKRKIQSQQLLLQGLQQLQKLLSLKQIDTNTIINLFKRVLQK